MQDLVLWAPFLPSHLSVNNYNNYAGLQDNVGDDTTMYTLKKDTSTTHQYSAIVLFILLDRALFVIFLI